MAFESVDLATPAVTEDIPLEISEAFDIRPGAEIAPITCGLVNKTFVVRHELSRTVLQRMAEVIDPNAPEDAAAVSEYLARKGWESPQVFSARNGTFSARDNEGYSWRHQHHISSDGKTPDVIGDKTLLQAGNMLGRWHRDISSIDYTPKFGIPHFHDTAFYAEGLDEARQVLPDPRTRSLAGQVLKAYEILPELSAENNQVIHGDPKLDNMLYRGGEPFTLIDYDTLMEGSPWLDVGDLLRSVIGKRLDSPSPIHTDLLQRFTSTYHESAGLSGSSEDSFAHAMHATSVIATELAMRYLIDIHKKDYFSWDSDTFDTRRDNHVPRVELQMRVASFALELAQK